MRATALIAVLLLVVGQARAQREFVEEIQPADDVDLDAPDPALGKKPPPPAPPPAPPPKTAPPPTPTPAPTPTSPPPPSTATPPPAIPDGPPPGEGPAGTSFTIVEGGRAAFLEKIAPHFAAVARQDAAAARKTLTGIQQGALEAGVAGLPEGFAAPAVAHALLREARAAVEAGQLDDASGLIEQAEALAPSDLSVGLSMARLRLTTDGVGAVINSVGSIARAAVASPIDAGNLLARLAAALVGGILMTLLAVTIAVAVPALRLVAFELQTRLPRGVHRFQTLSAVALVAVLPLALGLGLVPGLLWVGCLALLGLSSRQRLVVVATGVVALATPLLVDLGARGWTAAQSPAALWHAALYDVDGDRVVAKLVADEAAGVDLELPARVAIANAARREGRVADAVARYRELVKAHSDVSWVHGGYAVALATAGDADLALAEFGIAIEQARGEPGGDVVVAPAAFNASLLHHAAGRTEKAQAMLASVSAPGPDTISRLRRATYRAVDEVVHHNRAFAEVLPPRRALWEGMTAAPAAPFATALGTVLWQGPSAAAWPLLGGLVGLMVLLALVGSRVETACACGRCGDPASRRADGADVPRGTCAACYHAFISTKSRVDGAVRLRKENAIRRRAMRRARLVVMLSVWPGAGHLFSGAVLSGLILSLLAGVTACGAFVVGPWWTGPRLEELPPLAWVVPIGLAFAIVLAVAVRGALVLADEEKGALR